MTDALTLLGLLLLSIAPAASTQSLCNPCVGPPVRSTRPVTGLLPGEREIIDAEESRRLFGPVRQYSGTEASAASRRLRLQEALRGLREQPRGIRRESEGADD